MRVVRNDILDCGAFTAVGILGHTSGNDQHLIAGQDRGHDEKHQDRFIPHFDSFLSIFLSAQQTTLFPIGIAHLVTSLGGDTITWILSDFITGKLINPTLGHCVGGSTFAQSTTIIYAHRHLVKQKDVLDELS